MRLVPFNMFKSSSNYFNFASKAVLLLCILLLFVFRVCLCYIVLSVPCNLMITYWVRADLLALVYVFLVFFVTFPYGVPGGVAQSVTCLAADRCLTADPGIAS